MTAVIEAPTEAPTEASSTEAPPAEPRLGVLQRLSRAFQRYVLRRPEV